MDPSRLATLLIQRDLKTLQKDPPECASAGPIDEDLFYWHAKIIGPPDSPYRNGVFNVSIEFPSNYPYRPPKVLVSLWWWLADPNPNPDETLITEIADMYKNDRAKYDKTALSWTRRYAEGD